MMSMTFDDYLAATRRVVIEEEINFSEVFEVSAAHGLVTLELVRDEDHEPAQRDMIVFPIGHAEAIAEAIVAAARRARQ